MGFKERLEFMKGEDCYPIWQNNGKYGEYIASQCPSRSTRVGKHNVGLSRLGVDGTLLSQLHARLFAMPKHLGLEELQGSVGVGVLPLSVATTPVGSPPWSSDGLYRLVVHPRCCAMPPAGQPLRVYLRCRLSHRRDAQRYRSSPDHVGHGMLLPGMTDTISGYVRARPSHMMLHVLGGTVVAAASVRLRGF